MTQFFHLIVLLSVFCHVYVQGYYLMATVAGNGSTTTSGNGGPATSAGIASLYGMWVDSLGNLYLPDPAHPQVRMVDTAGIINRFIGSGTQSSSGSGGLALSVDLDGASCVYGDTAGNMYLSGSRYFIWFYNHTTGQVSRFAGATPANTGYSGNGGPATSAMLSSPIGLFLSTNGVVYIADTGNYVVRAVDTKTNIITTIAGNSNTASTGDGGPATSAMISPLGVWGNTAGILYIGDRSTIHNRIRKIATNGIITTVIGTGNSNYNGDNRHATSSNLFFPLNCQEDTLGNLYISDYRNYRVRIMSVTSGNITTIAGNGSTSRVDGSLHVATAVGVTPSMIQLDSLGNIYFQDNSYIRKLYNVATSAIPTVVPSTLPTVVPSILPTVIPTVTPSVIPTTAPTGTPTVVPNPTPTVIPTVASSITSTRIPSHAPSTNSVVPSPTVIPSFRPFAVNVTVNSSSRSQKGRDLHVFYEAFFPAFFILFCILPVCWILSSNA